MCYTIDMSTTPTHVGRKAGKEGQMASTLIRNVRVDAAYQGREASRYEVRVNGVTVGGYVAEWVDGELVIELDGGQRAASFVEANALAVELAR